MKHLIEQLPNLPTDSEGPVFSEPWQAEAFALAISLNQAGYFSWSEWVEQFSLTIKQAQASGDADLGDTYYHHWLNCLEKLLDNKSVVSSEHLAQRKEAWKQAYLSTPHGQPIELMKQNSV